MVDDFILADQSDLLVYSKQLFALRCRPSQNSQNQTPNSQTQMVCVEDLNRFLSEYEQILNGAKEEQESSDTEMTSAQVLTLLQEGKQLKRPFPVIPQSRTTTPRY